MYAVRTPINVRFCHFFFAKHAHAYLHGNIEFNDTPLAPRGTIVIINSKSNTQRTWADHGEDG